MSAYIISVVLVAMALAVIFFIVMACILTNHWLEYQDAVFERARLQALVLNNDIVNKGVLSSDVAKFNKKLEKSKKLAANNWTSWFCNQDIAAIDYIELPLNFRLAKI